MLKKFFTLQNVCCVDNKGFSLNPALEFDRITASYPFFQIVKAITYVTCPADNPVILTPEAQFAWVALAAGVEIGFDISVSFEEEKMYLPVVCGEGEENRPFFGNNSQLNPDALTVKRRFRVNRLF